MTIGDARKKQETTCPGRDRCQKISMLYDHDWAGDWQLGDAIVETCRKCEKELKQ